ncbi:MAG: DUF4445 domain-containing protein [Ruminococcaceae bacterium]|nr:DUF4445 domain-containing protein [Oscillospiraceae bacterium]
MHLVEINGRSCRAADGTLLSKLLDDMGISHEHPCGGRGICRKCLLTVNGKKELSCQYRIFSDIKVDLPEQTEILSETGVEVSAVPGGKSCLVLDIGTTTLALALVSIEEKKAIKVITGTNPQRAFGADVMARIEYCSKNGTEKLQKPLIEKINSMAKELSAEADTMYIAGNTTMLHIFFGVDCSSIGRAPYTPVFLEGKSVDASTLGIKKAKRVVSLPSISAFVGADIVAGLNFVSLPPEGVYDLLVDLGTNAEIVLFSKSDSLCTSAAAGPCFEAANISCGMSAVPGAIYAYSREGIKTVGDAVPKGICGTGLIDVVAELLTEGIIDEGGYMEDERYELVPGVFITQKDIREYQLAKSAVYSGVMTLLKMKGISPKDVRNTYISGGFSAKINTVNAAKTGLLPGALIKNCIPLNNSSLQGTVKYACESNRLEVYTENSTYVDLSGSADFSELFFENMSF